MTWEQIVIAAWLLWKVVFSTAAIARDRTVEYPTATIFVSAGMNIGIAVVLHCGGFW